MGKVINLRGTNGSGKTYLAKRWLESQGGIPYPRVANLLGGESQTTYKAQYYVLGDGGRLVGDYKAATGGCDGIDGFPAVLAILHQLIKQKPKYILFEGLLISGVYPVWRAFSQSVGGMIWVFLDTPLEVCRERELLYATKASPC